MVQILPEVPSFGSALARGLGGGIAQGLSKSAQFAQKLNLEKQKQKGIEGFIKQFSPTSGEGGKFQALPPEQEAMLAFKNPSAFNAYETLKKSHQEAQEKETKLSDLGKTVTDMAETLMKGNLGYTAKGITSSEGRRDRQYFDSLAVQLESIAKDLVSKGVLARDRFKYVLSNLPSSGKTDAANAGAIEAWSKALNLQVPEGLESLYKEKKAPGKSLEEIKKQYPPGTVLKKNGKRFRLTEEGSLEPIK